MISKDLIRSIVVILPFFDLVCPIILKPLEVLNRAWARLADSKGL